MRALIGISGPSESGKSHAALYLERECGTVRLKLVDVLAQIYRESIDADLQDFEDWPFRVERDRAAWLSVRLGQWFAMNVPQMAIATVESLYGPRMSAILRAAVECRHELWFIDAPFELRVHRQQQRADLATLAQARVLLQQRDDVKLRAGLGELGRQADFIITNDAEIADLHSVLRERISVLSK